MGPRQYAAVQALCARGFRPGAIGKLGSVAPEIEAWTAPGGRFIAILLLQPHDGWDIFVPVADSNDSTATWAALDARLNEK